MHQLFYTYLEDFSKFGDHCGIWKCNVALPPEEAKVRLGKWGMMHKDYMLKHKKVTVAIMTAEGRFWQYLAKIDKQAEEMFSRLVNNMAKAEGVTEQLKAENQMLWVQKMMNIEARAMFEKGLFQNQPP